MAFWNRRRGALPSAPPPPTPREPDPAPAFLAPPTQLRAMLDKDSQISGKLSFTGPTRIDGTLRGEVRASELLVIGETARVEGDVRAAQLVLLGRVEGQVLGAERVEIGPHGVLRGRLETRALVVHDGAVLDADCTVAAPRATVHVLHPRAEGEG